MLSMGMFETEIDFITHTDLQESICYYKLIVTSNDPDDLVGYYNDFL